MSTMSPRSLSRLGIAGARCCALGAVLCWLGCGGPAATEADAGAADAGPLLQGQPAASELLINELAPRPREGADWFELHNRSELAIDLCGYFATDDLERLEHYLPLGGSAPPEPCEPAWLPPGAYLQVFADDDPEAGPLHAPFKLGATDGLFLVHTNGLVADGLSYWYPVDGDGDSLARWPDGAGLFQLAPPSPGERNEEPQT